MKTISGMLVVVASVLMACGAMYDEGTARPGEAALATIEQQAVSTLATKDCSVSIRCADGTSRSCNGTSGACSASGSGNGSVSCNGSTTYCPSSLPDCTANGICNLQCSSDPDCIQCVELASCISNTNCGAGGLCQYKRCRCNLTIQ